MLSLARVRSCSAVQSGLATPTTGMSRLPWRVIACRAGNICSYARSPVAPNNTRASESGSGMTIPEPIATEECVGVKAQRTSASHIGTSLVHPFYLAEALRQVSSRSHESAQAYVVAAAAELDPCLDPPLPWNGSHPATKRLRRIPQDPLACATPLGEDRDSRECLTA